MLILPILLPNLYLGLLDVKKKKKKSRIFKLSELVQAHVILAKMSCILVPIFMKILSSHLKCQDYKVL